MPTRASSSHQLTVVGPVTISDPYSTNFPLTENPISEGGKWTNGQAVGLNWHDVQTTPNKAFAAAFVGTSAPARYSDDIAILKSSYSPDQYAQATVYRLSGYTTPSGSHELELLVRFSIIPGDAHGYEVIWGLDGYYAIVRWNGALGDYDPLWDPGAGSAPIPVDGDVLYAQIVGNFIKIYRNGVQIPSGNQAGTESTAGTDIRKNSLGQTVAAWTTGQPGIGMWPVPIATLSSLGWKSFQAGSGTLAQGGPTYVSSLAAYQVAALTSPTNGKATLQSVTPAIWGPGAAGQINDRVYEPWCGGPKIVGTIAAIYHQGGGHQDSYNNGLYKFDFSGTSAPVGWVPPLTISTPTVATAGQDNGGSNGDGLPQAVHAYDGMIEIGGSLYRYGGSQTGGGGMISALWRYTISNNQWTRLADGPFGSGGPLLGIQPNASLPNGKMVAIGGFGGNNSSYAFYAPGGSWSAQKFGTGLSGGTWPTQPSVGYRPTTNTTGTLLIIGADYAMTATVDWVAETITGATVRSLGALVSAGPILYYDAPQDLFLCMPGNPGSSTIGPFYKLNPATWALTTQALSGTTMTNVEVGGPYRGHFNRYTVHTGWRAMFVHFARAGSVYVIKLP